MYRHYPTRSFAARAKLPLAAAGSRPFYTDSMAHEIPMGVTVGPPSRRALARPERHIAASGIRSFPLLARIDGWHLWGRPTRHAKDAWGRRLGRGGPGGALLRFSGAPRFVRHVQSTVIEKISLFLPHCATDTQAANRHAPRPRSPARSPERTAAPCGVEVRERRAPVSSRRASTTSIASRPPRPHGRSRSWHRRPRAHSRAPRGSAGEQARARCPCRATPRRPRR
jgi:hypothetical protein